MTSNEPRSVAIYSVATTGYHYPLDLQARRVVASLAITPGVKARVILVTDCADNIEAARHIYKEAGIPVSAVVNADFGTNPKNYEKQAQLTIAQLRTTAMSKALSLQPNFVWSLDSDVIPPVNALRSMLDMLHFDGNYYDVAFCPYPTQGGGMFLGGRGDVHNAIKPNAYEDEKSVPTSWKHRRVELTKKLKKLDKSKSRNKAEANTYLTELAAIQKRIKDLPAKDNVFALNAKKWRQRGWFDWAYPGIGKGAVVPVEWTGSGCTLMTRRAAALCDWIGYDGGGTEDLYVNYHRWGAANLRICAVPHCPCDHVIRDRDTGELVHVVTYHEPSGECEGHLRQRQTPFYRHVPGERFKGDSKEKTEGECKDLHPDEQPQGDA